MNRTDILSIIAEAVGDLRAEFQGSFSESVSESTVLYGENGTFDSLGLVSLIVDVEQQFAQIGLQVTLTDDRAMSQRSSPFRTVQSLVDYITELLCQTE